MAAEPMAYIGKKTCGCAVAVIVDNVLWKDSVASDVSQMILDGYTVERVTVQESRRLVGPCKCGQQQTMTLGDFSHLARQRDAEQERQ